MKNPRWSRDELIVTLDFYMRYRKSIPDDKSKEITELSVFLNRLQDIVGGVKSDNKFRNSNGVYMKLMNFHRFDPDYKEKTLEHGNKDEEVVWNLYSSKPDRLRSIAESIRSLVENDVAIKLNDTPVSDGEDSEEGRLLTRTHIVRERDPKLTAKKREQVLKQSGHLLCEICGFNFHEKYGERGLGFIECHHIKPLSQLTPGEKTRTSDLSLVCSNCHKMIHRVKPWLTVDELKAVTKTSIRV
jgi:5-methylcytosine-specific restriction enzyme A